MASLFPAFTPLGRLYDPLLELASRVQDALSRKQQTVWTDDRGSVFVNDAYLVQSMSPASIIGTYDFRTPLFAIEDDLRIALRERASRWILDWNVQPANPRIKDVRMVPIARSRRKKRKPVPASTTDRIVDFA